MGKIYNALIAALFVLVLVLFYLHFSTPTKKSRQIVDFKGAALPIAFFEPDTIIAKYKFSVERQSELDQTMNKANEEIEKMIIEFDKQEKAYEAMEPSDEKEKALIALQELKQTNENKKEIAQQNIDLAKQKFQLELRKNIEDFLLKYNTPKRFSLIMIYEPGLIYYKDNALDITNDIIDGLNEGYEN